MAHLGPLTHRSITHPFRKHLDSKEGNSAVEKATQKLSQETTPNGKLQLFKNLSNQLKGGLLDNGPKLRENFAKQLASNSDSLSKFTSALKDVLSDPKLDAIGRTIINKLFEQLEISVIFNSTESDVGAQKASSLDSNCGLLVTGKPKTTTKFILEVDVLNPKDEKITLTPQSTVAAARQGNSSSHTPTVIGHNLIISTVGLQNASNSKPIFMENDNGDELPDELPGNTNITVTPTKGYEKTREQKRIEFLEAKEKFTKAQFNTGKVYSEIGTEGEKELSNQQLGNIQKDMENGDWLVYKSILTNTPQISIKGAGTADYTEGDTFPKSIMINGKTYELTPNQKAKEKVEIANSQGLVPKRSESADPDPDLTENNDTEEDELFGFLDDSASAVVEETFGFNDPTLDGTVDNNTPNVVVTSKLTQVQLPTQLNSQNINEYYDTLMSLASSPTADKQNCEISFGVNGTHLNGNLEKAVLSSTGELQLLVTPYADKTDSFKKVSVTIPAPAAAPTAPSLRPIKQFLPTKSDAFVVSKQQEKEFAEFLLSKVRAGEPAKNLLMGAYVEIDGKPGRILSFNASTNESGNLTCKVKIGQNYEFKFNAQENTFNL